jgi:hypothetical protein
VVRCGVRILRRGRPPARAERAAGGALASWQPAPGDWCVEEPLGHRIEAERRGFAGRIAHLPAGAAPRLASWAPPAVARARQDCAQSLAAPAADLTPADLARGGHYPEVGHLQAGDRLHEWVHHDRNHQRQMLAAVQAAVWPHMGNARRFSQPDLPAEP